MEEAITRENDFRPMLFPPVRVPVVARRYASDDHPAFLRVRARRTRDPVEKGLPDRFCLLSVQPEGDHSDLELVVRPQVDLLTPMVVEEMLCIEAHELTNQAPIVII